MCGCHSTDSLLTRDEFDKMLAKSPEAQKLLNEMLIRSGDDEGDLFVSQPPRRRFRGLSLVKS